VSEVLRQKKVIDPDEADEKGAYGVQWCCMHLIERASRGKAGKGKLGHCEKDGRPELFKDAVPELVKIFEKEGEKVWDGRRVDYYQRKGAIETRGAMGPSAKAAVPALKELVRQLERRGAVHPYRKRLATFDDHLLRDAQDALKTLDK